MSLNVYWSDYNPDNKKNWSILYEEPQSLYQHLLIHKEDSNPSFFNCPSFINMSKNVFVIKSPIDCHYSFLNELKIKDQVPVINNSSLAAWISHPPSLKKNILFSLAYSFSFFCESEIEISLVPPFFQKNKIFEYGAVVPGKFNIGSWFRPVFLEFNLWENTKEFICNEGDPLAYIVFNTDEKINLIRYQNTDKLFKILSTLSDSAQWEPKVPLLKRYKRFKNSKLKNIILKEIKNNLVN